MERTVRVVLEKNKNERISLGREYVEKALSFAGYKIEYCQETNKLTADRSFQGTTVYIGDRSQPLIKALEDEGLLLYHSKEPEGEGFYLAWLPGINMAVVAGGSDTGALYGALELSERIKDNNEIPQTLDYYDSPVFKLRGPAIGLQLTKIEPPRLTYEYPITPKRFPWFYDAKLWEKFLDQMLMERCNVIYIWTGQPFSSLVKLEKYPEALEVTEEEYTLNRDMFAWLADECNKRGIWLVLKFYSIHIPLPLAQKHGVELLQSQITPLNQEYTRLSIIEFIKSFPNIGLMVCLGEALRGTQNKTDWFIETIIPAVKEGIKEAGLDKEPPLILRGHDCDPNAIMEKAIPLYGNLYTMWKYNGESLATYQPTGKWQEVHKKLSSHGQTHIMNVHVLANLEPFRFGAPSFIQKCVQSGQNRLGVNGLHLYPLFFWDWPYSPDKASPRLLQMERDWMWYHAWFRYAWNPDRDMKLEEYYWINKLKNRFGCSFEAAEKILNALSEAGECEPRILRRVGITEGNRQTMNLGMTMSQFTNCKRYRPNYELWHSASTPGEQIDDYVQRKLKNEPHFGETPYDMMKKVTELADNALKLILETENEVTKNKIELEYYITDIKAIHHMVMSYVNKLTAAHKILEYKYSMDEKLRGDLSLLEDAVKPWEESLNWYNKLTEITKHTYLYANSMQTPQRKIPFPDGDAFGHWSQCQPKYIEEFENFKNQLSEMKKGNFPGEKEEEEVKEVLPQAEFVIHGKNCSAYTIEKGQQVFTDMPSYIHTHAPEISGLTGISFGLGEAITEGVTIDIELTEDSKVLIGYMNARGLEWLQVPDLETNTHADDRGGLAVVFANAMQAEGCPDINVHAFQYEKGRHKIYLGTGGFTIVGVVPAGHKIQGRNAGLSGETLDKLDWLYEPLS